jgi:glycine hydroxymethyltransferase
MTPPFLDWIQNDPGKPFVTSWIRIGTPGSTLRGFGTTESATIANLMADVLEAPTDESAVKRVAGEVTALCRQLPVYDQDF